MTRPRGSSKTRSDAGAVSFPVIFADENWTWRRSRRRSHQEGRRAQRDVRRMATWRFGWRRKPRPNHCRGYTSCHREAGGADESTFARCDVPFVSYAASLGGPMNRTREEAETRHPVRRLRYAGLYLDIQCQPGAALAAGRRRADPAGWRMAGPRAEGGRVAVPAARAGRRDSQGPTPGRFGRSVSPDISALT